LIVRLLLLVNVPPWSLPPPSLIVTLTFDALTKLVAVAALL
jgi:hypothetical protein